ncbi:high affinity sulfate transporter 2-like [Hibiscus syriacus]|uniref:High affinity sulfate transporter 2-like n=1 Tax=Hibiscus syriacus TaxID=106335 RepID=A0A6A2XB44_HIBSY|nr:heavy metal-associated isoprenylated plant protein 3-like [Hibiscus syriacus]KAE8672763.1 high affinity sulfate transporter 2-like [Hibiscus syriacus]
MKNGKMTRGFMCRSTSVNAACMAVDPRSVVMPRRRLDRLLIDDHDKRLINDNARYSRLVEPRRFVGADMKRPKHLQQPVQVASSELVFQVVVMRVSIHCQGCAGKVKKHLSKMEGVTSFSIDVESKRVTVMGHVSPAGVLESISKVKKAEFWPC